MICLTIAERSRLGDVIRRIRRRNGWTQAAFGARFGASQPIVSEWEAGTRKPNRSALLALAALGKGKESKVLATIAARWVGRRTQAKAPVAIAISHRDTSIAPVSGEKDQIATSANVIFGGNS